MAYSTDSDLAEVRSNIMGHGVADWSTQRTEAERQINRSLRIRWYTEAAIARGLDPTETAFDPNKASADQLKMASVFKTLELAYLHIANDATENPFLEQSSYFAKRYEDELKSILSDGVDYDWDDSGDITSTEKASRPARRLQRV